MLDSAEADSVHRAAMLNAELQCHTATPEAPQSLATEVLSVVVVPELAIVTSTGIGEPPRGYLAFIRDLLLSVLQVTRSKTPVKDIPQTV